MRGSTVNICYQLTQNTNITLMLRNVLYSMFITHENSLQTLFGGLGQSTIKMSI
jgi:hypothetical protein